MNIASTDRNSKVLRKYSELWNGIKDCIERINNDKLEEYDRDYMKIKFKSNDDIHLMASIILGDILDEWFYEV